MLTQRISNDRSTEYRTASRISIVTHLAWYHIKLVIHIQATFAIIFRSFWYMDLPFKYHDEFPVTLCYFWKLRTYNLKNHPSLFLEFQYLLFKALDFLFFILTWYTHIIIINKSIMSKQYLQILKDLSIFHFSNKHSNF